MILRASHAPRFTGFDSRPSDSPARMAAWVSRPPRSRRPCGIATKPKPLSVLSAKVVVAGDGFVGDDEIRLDQISHRQVVRIRYLRNSIGSCFSCVRALQREPGKLLAVHFDHLEFVQVQPLGGELAAKREKRGSAIMRPTSASNCFAQRAAGGQLECLAIGRSVPQEVGELGSQFVAVERLGRGRLAGFHQEQELRRGQHYQQRVLHAVDESCGPRRTISGRPPSGRLLPRR